jgi:hypothetical protein
MPLIEIPPYVLAGEPPPNARGWERAFHERSYLVAPPIDFPRELFAMELAEHAALLEEHLDALLGALRDDRRPAERDDHEDGDDGEASDGGRTVGSIDLTSSLLVSDGAEVEIHTWGATELSYVVQRCRGIVRKLMEAPGIDSTYVVVVARGVATMHRLVLVEPKRGDRPRLDVAERDLVVEPWDQWHRPDGRAVITWWRTPLGELAASRVVRPPAPRSPAEVLDAVVALYEPSVRRGIDAYVRENPKRRGLAVVVTSRGGDDLYFVDRFEGDAWLSGFPEVVRAAEKHHPGFDPVIVDASGDFAGVRWVRVGGSRDTSAPEGMVVPRRGWSWPTGERAEEEDPLRPRTVWSAPKPDREHWMNVLSERLARRANFERLRAPASILEHAEELVRKAIAELSPEDALAVVRASKAIAEQARLEEEEEEREAEREEREPGATRREKGN